MLSLPVIDDRRQDISVAVVEEPVAGEVLTVDAWADVGEGDVIGGVVGNKFVDQRRRGRVGEVDHHVDAGAGEAVLHGGKGVALKGRRGAGLWTTNRR